MKNHILVKYPDFRRLFLARMVSSIGDKFYLIALSWWILTTDATDAKFHLGLLMAVNVIPIILFGPLLGTFVDSYDKRKCMCFSDLCRFVLVLALSIILYTGELTITLLYVFSFFISALGPLFDTSAQSSIVKLTDEKHTRAAVALNSSVIQVAAVLGALLGSVFIHLIGMAGAFMFNAITYLISFYFVFRIQTDLNISNVKESFKKQFVMGFKYLRKSKPVLSLLTLFLCLNFFFAPLTLLLPVLTKDVLQKGANWLAMFECALAFGGVAMTFYLSLKTDDRSNNHGVYRTILFSTLFMGLSFMLIGYSFAMAVIFLGLFFIGLTLALTNSTAMSLFQNEVPDHMKGRFFSILYTVVFAIMPISYMLFGFTSHYISVAQYFLICGAGIILLSGFILLIPKVK